MGANLTSAFSTTNVLQTFFTLYRRDIIYRDRKYPYSDFGFKVRDLQTDLQIKMWTDSDFDIRVNG